MTPPHGGHRVKTQASLPPALDLLRGEINSAWKRGISSPGRRTPQGAGQLFARVRQPEGAHAEAARSGGPPGGLVGVSSPIFADAQLAYFAPNCLRSTVPFSPVLTAPEVRGLGAP